MTTTVATIPAVVASLPAALNGHRPERVLVGKRPAQPITRHATSEKGQPT
jgi:hypothetical protein